MIEKRKKREGECATCGEYAVICSSGHLGTSRNYRCANDHEWRVFIQENRDMNESNTFTAPVERALLDWCKAAGWEATGGLPIVELIERMKFQHCDERSHADLRASGGLPEAQVAALQGAAFERGRSQGFLEAREVARAILAVYQRAHEDTTDQIKRVLWRGPASEVADRLREKVEEEARRR